MWYRWLIWTINMDGWYRWLIYYDWYVMMHDILYLITWLRTLWLIFMSCLCWLWYVTCLGLWCVYSLCLLSFYFTCIVILSMRSLARLGVSLQDRLHDLRVYLWITCMVRGQFYCVYIRGHSRNLGVFLWNCSHY